ncbi:alpha-mannosidase [Marinilactibacillus sp. GCM10026970]|uniref:alpha-mannosidase n=1 Tax=Marinilactibacillus sp. GCM10026970 TaxID=3252642 RepID=UPI003618F9E7
MFFIEEKLKQRVEELKSYVYLDRKPIENLKIKEDLTKQEKYPIEVDETWSDISTQAHWEGRDRYFWIQGEVTVPEQSDDGDFVLLFDFGKFNPGNTSGFEALFFINGELYQGVDGNHKEVFIDSKFSNQTIQIALKLWGGLEGGGAKTEIYHFFKYADSAILSKDADDLYYTSKVILETIAVLDEHNSDRHKLLNLLNQTFNQLNWSEPGQGEFYSSVNHAVGYLNQEISKLEKHSDVTVTAIGHTHIDVAWLWSLKHTREKSARSFSTVLKLMEQYPEYIFLQTQPQLYEYVKNDYPELYEKIKEKIDEGRWEVDGAMWLESDANIPSGESLVRQILFGSRFIKKEFNRDTKYLWLPDVFGYSWALPQILKKSGIDMFMTTKISWNQFNRMPNDTFKWKGIDGSEVLTHFITTPDPNNEQGPFFYTYNGLIEPYTVKGIYDGYQDKNINQNLLLAYGYGDGGGGVNREMLEKARRIKKLPGTPHLKMGRADEYFEELKETFENTDQYVHTWDGELYLEYHRGTYTSQASNKDWNRKLELSFRNIEFLSTMLMTMSNFEYPQATINEGWKTILRNQFHDIIPGSSIKEVYKDSEKEYAEVNTHLEEMTQRIQNEATDTANTWTIFNSAAWKRDSVVFVEHDDTNKGYFTDGKGNKLESVHTSNGFDVLVKDIPGLGSMKIEFIETDDKKATEKGFEFSDQKVESPYYLIEWNQSGHLTRVYDKRYKREVLKESGKGNVLQLFEDKPMNWDAWDIDIFYNEKKEELVADKVEVIEHNHLYIDILFTYTFGQSKIEQTMRLYSHQARIDFDTTVDWKERQKLLKTAFEVDIRANEATYDIQYGNVKRTTHWNTSWDMARFESVGHQWVDLSEFGYGVSLMNNSKYGHDIKENTMRISLLKGAIYPDPEADLGVHHFTYSLLPHKGDFVEGEVVKEAWELNNPLDAFKGSYTLADPLFEVESEYPVMIDAIKKTEDGNGIIVRLHDYTGGKQRIVLTPKFKFKEVVETNLMEKEEEKLGSNQGIILELAPYEIKTFLFK